MLFPFSSATRFEYAIRFVYNTLKTPRRHYDARVVSSAGFFQLTLCSEEQPLVHGTDYPPSHLLVVVVAETVRWHSDFAIRSYTVYKSRATTVVWTWTQSRRDRDETPRGRTYFFSDFVSRRLWNAYSQSDLSNRVILIIRARKKKKKLAHTNAVTFFELLSIYLLQFSSVYRHCCMYNRIMSVRKSFFTGRKSVSRFVDARAQQQRGRSRLHTDAMLLCKQYSFLTLYGVRKVTRTMDTPVYTLRWHYYNRVPYITTVKIHVYKCTCTRIVEIKTCLSVERLCRCTQNIIFKCDRY